MRACRGACGGIRCTVVLPIGLNMPVSPAVDMPDLHTAIVIDAVMMESRNDPTTNQVGDERQFGGQALHATKFSRVSRLRLASGFWPGQPGSIRYLAEPGSRNSRGTYRKTCVEARPIRSPQRHWWQCPRNKISVICPTTSLCRRLPAVNCTCSRQVTDPQSTQTK